MNARVLRILIRDVFRHAGASHVLGAIVLACLVMSALCAALEPRAADSGQAALTLFGGRLPLIEAPSVREAFDAFTYQLAFFLAGGPAVLIVLLAATGIVTSLVQPNLVTLQLARPVPRTALFLGRVAGIALLAFCCLKALGLTAFFTLLVRWGIAETRLFAAIGLGCLQVAYFLPCALLLAVMTRHGGAVILGVLLTWAVSWAMNLGWLMLVCRAPAELLRSLGHAASVGYWIMPKPVDLGWWLASIWQRSEPYLGWFDPTRAGDSSSLSLGGSIASSLAFAVVVLALSVHEFCQEDY